LTGTPNSLASSRMWPSFILSTAICLNVAGRRSHFRFAFLDIPFSPFTEECPTSDCLNLGPQSRARLGTRLGTLGTSSSQPTFDTASRAGPLDAAGTATNLALVDNERHES